VFGWVVAFGKAVVSCGMWKSSCEKVAVRKVLTVYNCIKLQVDLQADKSPIMVKGPFFPRVVNPRYRIRGTMRDARLQSSKGETLMHLIEEHQKRI
jgi:hypothetical protein